MMVILRPILASGAPARPRFLAVLIAIFTAIVALSALVGLGALTGHVLLIPPMAASMALIAGAPSLPLSQPRNVIGGQLISAIVGIVVGLVSHSMWAAAIAGGLALGIMLFVRMSHSPAAATAVVGVMTVDGQWAFIICAGIAATVLVVFGLIRSAFQRTTYPEYWW